MSTMTITVERTPRKVMRDGQMIEVEELSIRLPFARKPENLSALGGEGLHRVWVTETRVLSQPAFDEFASHLLKSRDWLAGKAVAPAMPTSVSKSAPLAGPICMSILREVTTVVM